MDGVPFITQCPIDFATKFRYSFNATEPGTQFYHSHAGHHKANGHNGGIVVRRSSKKDPNSSLYDRDKKDHLIVITDWMDEDAEMFFPGLRTRGLGAVPTNFLINGKGTLHDVNFFLIIDLTLPSKLRASSVKYRKIHHGHTASIIRC